MSVGLKTLLHIAAMLVALSVTTAMTLTANSSSEFSIKSAMRDVR